MNNWSVSEVTAPQEDLISLQEAKEHLRVTSTAEDALIASQITAAREWIESHIGYVTVKRTLKLNLDSFPSGDTITLPRSKLISIESVEYVDRDGNTQTWPAENYTADTDSVEGRLIRSPDTDWPDTKSQRQAVQVQYVAGHESADSIPGGIKSACKILVANFYAHRESVVVGTITAEAPMSALSLLHPHRRMYL